MRKPGLEFYQKSKMRPASFLNADMFRRPHIMLTLWGIYSQHLKYRFPVLLVKSENMMTLGPNSHMATVTWSWVLLPLVKEHRWALDFAAVYTLPQSLFFLFMLPTWPLQAFARVTLTDMRYSMLNEKCKRQNRVSHVLFLFKTKNSVRKGACIYTHIQISVQVHICECFSTLFHYCP